MFRAVSPRATFAVTKRPVLHWLMMVEFYFLLTDQCVKAQLVQRTGSLTE